MSAPRETIAAVATAQGRGGVGIVRISGPLAGVAAQRIVERCVFVAEPWSKSFYEAGNSVNSECGFN